MRFESLNAFADSRRDKAITLPRVNQMEDEFLLSHEKARLVAFVVSPRRRMDRWTRHTWLPARHKEDSVNIQEKTPRHALTRTGGFLKGYTHSLNPYGGCAFGRDVGERQGCPFCYVRESPVARFGPGGWGAWILVKKGIDGRLAAELKRLDRTRTRVFMSSATDPYQGIERRYELTRRCLKTFARFPIAALVLQTRSVLIERDFDLLSKMKAWVLVSLTLETNREDIRRALTPTSPTVAARLRVARHAKDLGIPIQIVVAPVLPHILDAFADALASSCDRVVVDTLTAGDGARGARSRRLDMNEKLAGLGFPGWMENEPERPLMRKLTQKMGAERVLFSQSGFADFSWVQSADLPLRKPEINL